MGSNGEERLVRIEAGSVLLEGNLSLPEGARGIVLFAHGSGSSRLSPRNRHVAKLLNQARLATLLVDLLSPEEEAVDLQTAQLRSVSWIWPAMSRSGCRIATTTLTRAPRLMVRPGPRGIAFAM